MKRDMNLVRAILIAVEAKEDDTPDAVTIPGYDADTISRHVELMHEAGLMEALDDGMLGEHNFEPIRLTWDGHEFLDLARSDTVWQRAQARLKDLSIKSCYQALFIAMKALVSDD